jgi:hypothetical protein
MSKARDLANAGTALTTVSATELGYLDGVTSAVQTQIDSKIGSASAINPTIVDAKGDIVAATAADTVARLAVGTNNHVLTADSAEATGLKWAAVSGGGMTSLATGSLSGTSVTISSISGSYRDLVLVILGAKNATANSFFRLRVNGDSGASNYFYSYLSGGSTTLSGDSAQSACFIGFTTSTSTEQLCVVTLPEYANTTGYKVINSTGAATSNNALNCWGGYKGSTSAVTSITILENAGYTFNGGTYTLYGVK